VILLGWFACTGAGLDDSTLPPTATLETEVTWQELPGPCEDAGSAHQDPVEVGPEFDGRQLESGRILVELVELEVHADQGLLFASGQAGLQTFAVDPVDGTLTWLSMYPDDGFGRFEHLEVLDEGRVAAAARAHSVEIIDLSDPAAPVPAWLHTEAGLTGLAYGEGHLYIASQAGELVTVEILPGWAGREVDRTDGLGSPWELVLRGERLYVADQSQGLVVYDLSVPEAPVWVAAVPDAIGALDLELAGDHLYVALGGAGVGVYDLGDPDLPARVATLDIASAAVAVAVDGDRLWAVDHDGVVLADVADPGAPVSSGFQRTSLYALHVDAAQGRAWVADWTNVPSYRAVPGVRGPSARPVPRHLFLPRSGEPAVLELRNGGGAPLVLSGGEVDDERVDVRVSGTTAEVGGSLLVEVRAEVDGIDLDATLCLATDDPQTPLLEVPLGSADFNDDPAAGSGGLTVGDPAVDFVLEDLDRVSWRLSEQLGHPVALVYFATW